MRTQEQVKNNKKQVQDNYQHFLQHRSDLIKKHKDEFVLIHQQEFIDFYQNVWDAISDGKAKFGTGNFSVQEVTEKIKRCMYVVN